jgi:hypothetical protein
VSRTSHEAFRYFTGDFGVWWPAATHSVVAYASGFKDKPATVILEPRVNGRIFERTRDGDEHLWGTVLAWQPPARVEYSASACQRSRKDRVASRPGVAEFPSLAKLPSKHHREHRNTAESERRRMDADYFSMLLTTSLTVRSRTACRQPKRVRSTRIY